MQGYARLEVERALKARENYIKFMDEMELKFPEFVQRYYNQEFPKLSTIGKWFRRKQTPAQFLREMLGWNSYTGQLYKVLNDKELDDVDLYSDRYNINQVSRTVRKLCHSSSDGFILVDQDIAGFIEKWENAK